jgi:CubicO group peptidase (beta-lactamase class C family)
MAAIHFKVRVRFDDGSNAAGLNVRVHENFGGDFDCGVTNGEGIAERDLREVHKIRVPNNPLIPWGPSREIDDPLDHPTFQVTVADVLGQSNSTGPHPDAAVRDLRIRLPRSFQKLSPHSIADIKLSPMLDNKAPGRVFYMRKNGVEWANACKGQARLTRPGEPGRVMTNNTIIHIASMSKPICATAIVAMIDDWTAIQAALANPDLAPTQQVRFAPALGVRLGGRQRLLTRADVPAFLAPLFRTRKVAKGFLDEGLLNGIPGNGAEILRAFAASTGVAATPARPTPPGHVGLLRRLLRGTPPPNLNTPFLPLVQGRLDDIAGQVGGTTVIGANIAAITLGQLLRHTSTIVNGINNNPALRNLPGFNEARVDEPIDGSAARFNLWAYLLMLLRQDANAGGGYKNDNYTCLGGVIEACTETSYDDYVETRLLMDGRFDRIRRRVVNQAASALYYQGGPPFWTTGNPLPDYRGFSAAGGFYATGVQMTDWLHALVTRANVDQVLGAAPLVSTNGVALLFDTTGVFSGGNIQTLGAGSSIRSYPHNGGTGVGSGSINGKMAVFRGPGGDTHTAFMAGNGNFDAEPPFNQTIDALIQNAW